MQQNLDIVYREESKTVVDKIIILLKSDNQGLIVLIHNPFFYFRTKHIDIQYYYIYNKIASQKIKLIYILSKKMITEGFIKALIHIKFHFFIE